jgi:hypothetical protein
MTVDTRPAPASPAPRRAMGRESLTYLICRWVRASSFACPPVVCAILAVPLGAFVLAGPAGSPCRPGALGVSARRANVSSRGARHSTLR